MSFKYFNKFWYLISVEKSRYLTLQLTKVLYTDAQTHQASHISDWDSRANLSKDFRGGLRSCCDYVESQPGKYSKKSYFQNVKAGIENIWNPNKWKMIKLNMRLKQHWPEENVQQYQQGMK